MKKFLFLLFFPFTGLTASGQVNDLLKDQSSEAVDSLKKADREVNRKFLNKGNTLLNMRGSIPKSLLIVRPQRAKKPNEDTSQEKLVVNTLLFTGKLQDHLSRPFMLYSDTLIVKPKD